MLAIVETETLEHLRPYYQTEQVHGIYIIHQKNPEIGDVVRGGIRKVRWGKPGSGKSGGLRVIYFNRLANGEIWLVLIY